VRLLALYLLSVAAVQGAALAWRPGDLAGPLGLLGPPLLLAAAAYAGAAAYERLAWIAERAGRGRLHAAGATLHSGVLLVALLGLLIRQRDAVEAALRWLSIAQPLLLLLAGFGRSYHGAVLNAGALTILAGFGGGLPAAASVVAHVSLLAVFLVADHVARKLVEYPVEDAPGPRLLLREAGLPALGAAAALSLFFALLPPEPYAAFAVRPPPVGTLRPEMLGRLLVQVTGIAVLTGVGFYLLLRWNASSAASGREDDFERVRARRRAEPSAADVSSAPEAPASGARGRIVRAYLGLLGFLARQGVRRRRGQTPSEFSVRLGPSGEAVELTGLFIRARYGDAEPGEGGAEAAERAARALEERHRAGGSPAGGNAG
jgi:hypothetical protein